MGGGLGRDFGTVATRVLKRRLTAFTMREGRKAWSNPWKGRRDAQTLGGETQELVPG